ncbi:Uncharacterized protein PBTT_07435 [Plasmodiophora brassicae]|uniref:Uncharacterized protein n=1 Tax=Plasmodiophora brassicae TaxID=37360 RepID=A0A0G4IMM2_PLABS|nr:hypothetical protein PBRA_005094 [Plasmodiophora brassicae]
MLALLCWALWALSAEGSPADYNETAPLPPIRLFDGHWKDHLVPICPSCSEPARSNNGVMMAGAPTGSAVWGQSVEIRSRIDTFLLLATSQTADKALVFQIGRCGHPASFLDLTLHTTMSSPPSPGPAVQRPGRRLSDPPPQFLSAITKFQITSDVPVGDGYCFQVWWTGQTSRRRPSLMNLRMPHSRPLPTSRDSWVLLGASRPFSIRYKTWSDHLSKRPSGRLPLLRECLLEVEWRFELGVYRVSDNEGQTAAIAKALRDDGDDRPIDDPGIVALLQDSSIFAVGVAVKRVLGEINHREPLISAETFAEVAAHVEARRGVERFDDLFATVNIAIALASLANRDALSTLMDHLHRFVLRPTA